jgi:predicted esterase
MKKKSKWIATVLLVIFASGNVPAAPEDIPTSPETARGGLEYCLRTFLQKDEATCNLLRARLGRTQNVQSLITIDAAKHPDLYKKVLPNLEIRTLTLQNLVHNAKTPEEARAIVVLYQDLVDIMNDYDRGKDFFDGKAGRFVKAYRASADDSIQPYHVSVPESYDPAKPSPLVVSLHGYGGDKLTREYWTAERSLTHTPEKNKHNIIVLNIYGRGNTLYHGLGKQDVFCAMDEVTRDYSIDPQRVYLRGGSMGGHGTWFVSIYHPDRFAAISPMCGYCYRFKHDRWEVVPPWAYQATLTEYGLSFFAENYLHVPNNIHHGEVDKTVSVENSRTMSKCLKDLGYDCLYKEYKGVGHDVWTVVDSASVYDWLMQYKLDPYPKRVIYKTPTLRYNHAYWVTIDEFIEANSVARIEAEVTAPNTVTVKTRNVRQFSLQLPEKLFDRTKAVAVLVDEMPAMTFAVAEDSPETISLRKSPTGPAWADSTGKTAPGLRKRHGLQGPMTDIYEERFIYVYGSAGDDEEDRINQHAASRARDAFTGAFGDRLFVGKFRVKKDTEVSGDDLQNANLILIGRPESNEITKKIQSKLPIRLEGDTIVAKGNLPAKDLHIAFIYPNPLNPQRYVFVQYATDAKSFESVPKSEQLPDYMIFQRVSDGKITKTEFLDVGHFNGRWQFDREE